MELIMSLSPLQNIRSVIFDFDGTIADTSEGIIDAHRFALDAMGHEEVPEQELRNVIGGNLLNTYINTFGFEEEKAVQAVAVYRKRYAEVGIHKASVYDDFEELLKELRAKGCMIGAATLKAEIFAKEMLKEMGIFKYFDVVCGMDLADKNSKASLVGKCVDFFKCEKREAVLVGDSMNDYSGAAEAGVAFVGVTYGFGFKKDVPYDHTVIDAPLELIKVLDGCRGK